MKVVRYEREQRRFREGIPQEAASVEMAGNGDGMPATLPTDLVASAYERCRRITMQHARTFYFASRFLPIEKRNACYAVYAFCRYMDDLIDERMAANTGTIDRRMITDTVAMWRHHLDQVYQHEFGRDGIDRHSAPVMVAWADTLERFHIDRELPDQLIEGVMMDLQSQVRIATFGELYDYCYKVASVVGLMTSEIFGYTEPRALAHAVDLGIAMQLTNILRDVGEDYRTNRIYIPAEELERFGVDEQMIARGVVTDQWRRLMQFQIERANRYYQSANLGIPMLDADSRLTVRLMSHNYGRILEMIERNDYDVFTRRASVPLWSKLASLVWLMANG